MILAPAAQSKGKNTLRFPAVSPNQKYLAVCVIPGGSELDGELHIFDMATGRETGDVISDIGGEAGDVSWLPDNHSFLYGHNQRLPTGAPQAEIRQKFRTYKHVLGTTAAEDKPIFGYGVDPSIRMDPTQFSYIQIPYGSQYALGTGERQCESE